MINKGNTPGIVRADVSIQRYVDLKDPEEISKESQTPKKKAHQGEVFRFKPTLVTNYYQSSTKPPLTPNYGGRTFLEKKNS